MQLQEKYKYQNFPNPFINNIRSAQILAKFKEKWIGHQSLSLYCIESDSYPCKNLCVLDGAKIISKQFVPIFFRAAMIIC
jgi:hypothetical protein